MSDTAAFFANKKKKKKAFKFNANLIDASAVSNRDHIEAPAVSSPLDSNNAVSSLVKDMDPKLSMSQPSATSANDGRSDQWDDTALAVNTASSTTTSRPTAEVKTLQAVPTRGRTDNIAEKLRVEETKAQLAAARQGMEREAAKLEEEKRQKEAKKQQETAAINPGGRWVSPRLMMQQQTSMRPTSKLDVSNEELFPDLASAGKILEEKSQQPKFSNSNSSNVKKTPVGGGASWASKIAAKNRAMKEAKLSRGGDEKSSEKKEPVAKAEAAPPKEDEKPVAEKPAAEKPAPEKPTAEVKKSSTLADKKATLSVGTKPKKKKKDLSTFKAAS